MSFSDLFKLGKEVLKTETFVLHEAQPRGGSEGHKCLVKCLFIFGMSKTERAQVSGDIRTFRKAKHPCILELQDVVAEPEDRFCYMIYEHMAGGSLTEHLGTGRQFAEEEVRAIVGRILEALVALHSLGLYHGHVTPARIFFSDPRRDEVGAATAKLCYLEKMKPLSGSWEITPTTSGTVDKDCRDADIISLGLAAFAAFMGDAGAATGEPLDSFRATNESTGVPELSPQGREAIDLMLGSDPTQAIPSAEELLRHRWFPVDDTLPMPLGPGETVPFGPPVRPERAPTGIPPLVPKMADVAPTEGKGMEAGDGDKASPMVDMPDGSQALCSWLYKKSERSTLGLRNQWQQRWFVLNPSTSTLLIFNHEVHLNVEDHDSQRKCTGHLPKAFPLDCSRVQPLLRPSVKDRSSHSHILVVEDKLNRFPSLQLSFNGNKTLQIWLKTFRSIVEGRSVGTRPRANTDSGAPGALGAVTDGGGAGATDWWDEISHQAQRVAHVTAASMFSGANGEAELSRFVEEKLQMHKRTAKSLHLNGSVRSGGTSLFGGGGSMVLPTSNNAGTIFKNSALHWERRVDELAAVTSGKPINSAILPGERWFIVDARWMDHWLEFCTSKRRMAPPGPVDNSWMLHAEKRHVPYEGLTLAQGKQAGDFRRVGQECWDQLMRLYGGGPAIYVDGPPVEDLSRWVVRFGHQVATKSSVRRAYRHIPNPNVSVGNLQEAAKSWVGGWDEDDEDDDDNAELDDDVPMALAVHDSHVSAGGNLGVPLAVLPEEDLAD